MSRKLIVSRTAEADLNKIFDWIVRNGRPRTALRHTVAIRSRFLLLARSPFLGRDRSDKQEGLRTYSVRGATIVYLVHPDQVFVLGVLGVLGRGRDVDAALDEL